MQTAPKSNRKPSRRPRFSFRDLMLMAILILLTGVMLAIGALGQSAIDPQGFNALQDRQGSALQNQAI
jgi:hypothetical protein